MSLELLHKIIQAITTLGYKNSYIYDYISYAEIYQAISEIRSGDEIVKHLDILCDIDLIRYLEDDGNEYYCPTSLAYIAAISNDSKQLFDILRQAALQIKLQSESSSVTY